MQNKKIKYLFARYDEMYRTYFSDNGLFKRVICFIDWVFSYVIFGSSISDYFTFGFYYKRISGRNKYITFRRHKKIQKIANDKRYIELCRNKLKFNDMFRDFLGRSSVDFDKLSKEAFSTWLTNVGSNIFVKDVYSYRGKGIYKVNQKETDMDMLFQKLKNDFNSHYIIEDEIEQNKLIAEFHPWSVNTIRIVTLYDTKNNVVHIMNARLRMGNNRRVVDNFHAGGIDGHIDIASGIICSKGFNMNNEVFVYHPISKKQIVGFKIPFWEECKEYIVKAAKTIPQVRYIGWDIVVLENARFAIIEANDNADHDTQQIHNSGGVWPTYKKILQNMK